MFTAQPNRIVITELIAGKSQAEIVAPAIARNFIEKMPKIDYQVLRINPKVYLGCGDNAESASHYFTYGLFAPAFLQEYATANIQTSIDLKFTSEKSNLYLKIAKATINNGEQSKEYLVLFSGNFKQGLTKGKFIDVASTTAKEVAV